MLHRPTVRWLALLIASAVGLGGSPAALADHFGVLAQGGQPPDFADRTPPAECDQSPWPPCDEQTGSGESGNGTRQGGSGNESATGGDPVDAYTGRLFFKREDLVVKGVVPIRIVRQYDSQSRYDSPLGYGWSLTYDLRLFTQPPTTGPVGNVVVRGWEGRRWRYLPPDDTLPPPQDLQYLEANPSLGGLPLLELDATPGDLVEHVLTFDNGERALFDSEGRLYALETPQGNRLRFSYSAAKVPLSGRSAYALDPTLPLTVAHVWQITEIREQLASQVDDTGVAEKFTGRKVTFAYDDALGNNTQRLIQITSHDGRSVTYDHVEGEPYPDPSGGIDAEGFRGNLASVTGPAGIVETYRYPPSPVSPTPTPREHEHIHNLTWFDDGVGTEVHESVYHIEDDRVTDQTYGLSQWSFDYDANPPTETTITRTIETPDLGMGTSSTAADTIYRFNGEGFLVEKVDAELDRIVYDRSSGPSVQFVEVYENGSGTASRRIDFTYYTDTLDPVERLHVGRQATRAVVLAGTGETVTESWDYEGRFVSRRTVQSDQPKPLADVFETRIDYLDADSNGWPENVDQIRRRNGAGTFITTSFDYDPQHHQLTLTTLPNPASGAPDHLKIRRVYYPVVDDPPPGTILSGLLQRIELVTDDGVNPPVTLSQLTRSFDYDTAGNLTSITDARTPSHTTELEWDARGRILRATEQIGGAGNQANWESTLIRYGAPDDGATPGLFVHEIETGALGATGTTTAGQVRRFRRDLRGRTFEVQRDDGGSPVTFAELVYDSDDNLVQTSQPAEAGDRILTMGYDKMRRLVSVTDAAGSVTTFEYDALGNRTKLTDALSATYGGPHVTDFVYDELDRLTQVVQNGVSPALTTGFEYDAAGNVTKVLDPKDQETEYQYDELSRLRKVTQALGLATPGDPDDFVVDYLYDDRDRLDLVTNARGHTLDYAYFPWGGLEKIEHDLDGGGVDRTISFTYDDNGNIATTTDDTIDFDLVMSGIQTGTLYTFTYDALNRVEDVTAHYIPGTPLLRSTYDPFGNRASLALNPSGENLLHEWNFNDLNQLESVCLPQDIPCTPLAETLRFTYADNDDLDVVTHGNGLTTDFTLYLHGPLQSIRVEDPDPVLTEVHELIYGTVDEVLNIRAVTEEIAGTAQTPDHQYDYDGIYRLTDASYPSGLGLPPPEGFTYDDAGNRDDAASPGSHTYDANNRLTMSAASPVVCHDEDGNLTSKRSSGDCSAGNETETFAFDATNRLEERTDITSSDTTTFVYDPFGRRLRKTHDTGGGATTTWYLWDGDQLLGEYDTSGTRDVRYAYAGGFAPMQVAYNDGGETVYDVHTDHLDTPRLLTDAAQTVVWRASHEAFGHVPATALDENPDGDGTSITFNVRFPGQYYDEETGLHYNRFRYYDPAIGRYISADPIGQSGGANLYAYALNSPTAYIDPLGEVSAGGLALGVAVACAAATTVSAVDELFDVADLIQRQAELKAEADNLLATAEALDDLAAKECDPVVQGFLQDQANSLRERALDKTSQARRRGFEASARGAAGLVTGLVAGTCAAGARQVSRVLLD
jgi:RHS repeat-associated protein